MLSWVSLVSFMHGFWLSVGSAVAGVAAWNSVAAVFALLLAAAIVFWCGFHSIALFSEGRASLWWAARQGFVWSMFLSGILWGCMVLFASSIGLSDLAQAHVLRAFARSFFSVVGV